ncbi:MAG: aldo/keto reductase, partial [Bacteroidales bacterium]|nr:aldo/keto reductase [Bacteroidales bacterium]
LTDKYLNGIPEGSRMTVNHFLKKDVLTDDLVAQLKAWNEEAAEQGLSLAQYALKWILRRPEVTSVIVGASSVEQLKNNLEAIK